MGSGTPEATVLTSTSLEEATLLCAVILLSCPGSHQSLGWRLQPEHHQGLGSPALGTGH